MSMGKNRSHSKFMLIVAICLSVPLQPAWSVEEFAPLYEANLEYRIHPAVVAGTPEETVSQLRSVLETASQILQARDHSSDAYCPVSFGFTDLVQDPMEGFADSAGTSSNISPMPYPDTGHLAGLVTHGGSPAGWANRGINSFVLNAVDYPLTELARIIAHESGHLADVDHCGSAGTNLMVNLQTTQCSSPPVTGNNLTVMPFQCEQFIRYASDLGRKAECLLQDLSLENPIYPAPRWSSCKEGGGYCDGEGRCIESDLECVGADGPLPRGTDCSDAEMCRACVTQSAIDRHDVATTSTDRRLIRTACVPCATKVESEDAASLPTLYFIAPGDTPEVGGFEAPAGGLLGSDTLFQLVSHSVFAPSLRNIVDIERDVVGLAVVPGKSVFYTVAPDPEGVADDVLLRLDPAGSWITEIGSLGAKNVVALTFGANESTLYGAQVDPNTGQGNLLNIDPRVATFEVRSAVSIDPVVMWITDLAYDSVSQTPTLYASATELFEITISGAASQVGEGPFPSIAFDAGIVPSDPNPPSLWGVDPETGIILPWRDILGTKEIVSLQFPGTNRQQGMVLGGLCGNGVVELGEACDDGNVYNGDGCTAACESGKILVEARIDTNDNHDGVVNALDNCPFDYNPTQEDGDADGVGDACDNCLSQSNPNQSDADQDLVGDACDTSPDGPDTDGDGITDVLDNCPTVYTIDPSISMIYAVQGDADGDGLGDACDPFPDDPNNELDQRLNPPPQCSDGIDNDGDGRIDLDDRHCKSADQNLEKSSNR